MSDFAGGDSGCLRCARSCGIRAVANAVIDALEPWGITHLDIPFTPEKVWRAINEVGGAAQTAD